MNFRLESRIVMEFRLEFLFVFCLFLVQVPLGPNLVIGHGKYIMWVVLLVWGKH